MKELNIRIVLLIGIALLALEAVISSGATERSPTGDHNVKKRETQDLKRKKRENEPEPDGSASDPAKPDAETETEAPRPKKKDIEDTGDAGATGDKSAAGANGGLISDAEFETEPPHDPFSILKWTQFKTRAKHIQEALLNLTDTLINSQGSSAKSNGGGVTVHGMGPILQAIAEFFAPLDEELLDAIPYTLINPAVGLYTKPLLNSLVTTKPSNLRDRTRLLWVEVNALAITTHYTFERIFRLLSEDGDWGDVLDSLTIEYPSWLEEVNSNDTEAYQLMNVPTIVDRVHSQFDVLGEKYQLLRGLEKLLRKKLKDLNPEKTNLNLYCYGNNDYIMVYDVPDLLTDAALYLIMADMKYFAFQVLNVVASAPADSASWTTEYEQCKKNLTTRIDKKINIGEPVEAAEPPPASGPTLFPCDPKPKPAANETKLCLSSPLSPDVHIIANVPTFVDGNQPAALDPKTKAPVYENGTRIPGIEVARKFLAVDGTPIPSTEAMPLTASEDGKVVDGNGTEIEGATVQYIYIPYDDLPRGNTIPKFSSVEWGKFHCDISPNSSHPEVPNEIPFGPLVGGGPGPDDKTPAPPGPDGYTDNRMPDFEAAQFGLAYSGYIEAELVLNQHHTCAGTCRDFHSEHGSPTACMLNSNERCQTYRDAMCQERGSNCLRKSQCAGKARRCVRTARTVEICESKTSSESGRIYDWIKFSDGRIITAVDESDLGSRAAGGGEGTEDERAIGGNGTTPSCATKVQVAEERYWMDFGVIMAAPEYCELCLCVCDDPLVPEGHHVFGLHPITVKEGYVVTALRFEQNGNTMQMNVEQAKWAGNGHVETDSVEWLEVPEIDKLAKDATIAKLGPSGFTKVNLDSVFVAANEVVTGIRLVLEGDALSIQVQGTPVESDGKLGATPTEWTGTVLDNSTARQEVDLSDAESSIKQKGPSQPLYSNPADGIGGSNETSPMYYVRFDASSLLKDGGQSVIPFFDLQPSHHHFAFRKALQGVGISYKAKHGYGGFLVPAVNIYKKYF